MIPGQTSILNLVPTCEWCGDPIPATMRADARFCGVKHRQASHRSGKPRSSAPRARAAPETVPLRLAVALAWKSYASCYLAPATVPSLGSAKLAQPTIAPGKEHHA
ncbi:MAG: hypothetical protein WKF96_00230 [Solirubrobacteraceae bacterium]